MGAAVFATAFSLRSVSAVERKHLDSEEGVFLVQPVRAGPQTTITSGWKPLLPLVRTIRFALNGRQPALLARGASSSYKGPAARS